MTDKVFNPVKLQLSQIGDLVMLDEKIQVELMRQVPRLPANHRHDDYGVMQDIWLV